MLDKVAQLAGERGSMLSPQDELRREFAPSEEALWTGQPRQGIVFRAPDIFFIPFTLIWCGMAVTAFAAMLIAPKGPPLPFAIIPSLFVLIGLYLVFGRFWVDARQRARTFYAVTNDPIV